MVNPDREQDPGARAPETRDDAAGHEPDPEPAPRARSRAISRRRFVGLIAAGAGAALAAPARARAETARAPAPPAAKKPARAPAAPALPQRVSKGLAEQRESLAKTLKTIRDFELPPGSEQGFAFRPLPARRKS